jgi:hypothetical protein
MTFLTGITQGRPDRQHRPVVATVDERVSLEAVVNAIADIMGDHNRFGIVDRTLASRIGREVQTAVATAIGSGRISSSSQLTSQQAFWGILVQHLASTSSAHTDQQARQSLLHYMRTQANRTAGDFAAFVAQFRRGGGYADRSDRDGGAVLTSARFDGFSSADAASLSAMRRYALDRGLYWAADRPDILHLGPAAIEALAAVNLRREMFERSIRNGYTARDVVGLVRYARELHAGDRERAREVLAAANEAAELTDPVARERLRQLWQGLAQATTAEGRAAARQALIQGYVQHGRGRPQDNEFVERGLDALGTTAAERTEYDG